ncbi:MAG TPA: amidohydrolase family protein [Bryobacteraceae bacterium]|jgi:cytosine/adenosine deaminase-related metal-dependent hydrolase
MILAHARVALNATEAAGSNVEIRAGKILFLTSRSKSAPQLDLSGYLLLPGMINAHDHLEFNLFPRIGRGPYPNAAAWARDIYHPRRDPIRQHLRVPKAVRLFWGGLKNLLSGVTTVAHHNPYDAAVFDHGFPVRVVKNFGWSHSLDFSPNLIEDYRRTPRRWPFILHAAEGTDECARNEICRLDRSGVLGPRTVLVHAVAADPNLIRRRRASIVWCPSSNLLVLDRTLSAETFRSGVPIALGTDSALTAQGDLADEIAVARKIRRITAEEAFAMVTSRAAQILRLSAGAGTIRDRGVADLIAVRDRGKAPVTALTGLSPELVFVGGELKLASPGLAAQLPSAERARLQPIEIEGRGRFLVAADVHGLYNQTAAVLGRDFQLAGRRVGL